MKFGLTNHLLFIVIHQLLFQGMFVSKSLYLRWKFAQPIRGDNREATQSIYFFIFFIITATILAAQNTPWGTISLVSDEVALIIAGSIAVASLLIAAAALLEMRDSWRIGILEDQQTAFISSGIYAKSRNPFFVAYLLMFSAYAILLQNLLLLLLKVAGGLLINRMIKQEEAYLLRAHGEVYRHYQSCTPRYLFWMQ